jgi:hypothetical protein
MNSRTKLSVGFLALAFATCGCTITTTPSATNTAAKPDDKKAEAPKTAAPKTTASAKVPEPPKTPAPPATEKPAKAEAVPAKDRKQPPAPDSWTVIQNQEYGVQFKVPSHWNAGTSNEGGQEVFVAAAPDDSIAMVVATVDDNQMTDEQVLQTFVDNLGFKVDGEFQRVDDGLIFAHGAGNTDGQDVYFQVMVYAYEDVDYVTYLVTPAAQAEKNSGTMMQILETFELI